jgi:NADPH-dependent curcumin reductase CurA
MRIMIKGFIVSDYGSMTPQFISDMVGWTKAGKMKWHETIYDGIERAPDAFIGLFKGDNFGKMLVRIGPDNAV